MESQKIIQTAGKMIEELDKTDLRIDEKIAVAETIAGTYRAIINAEVLVATFKGILTNMFTPKN